MIKIKRLKHDWRKEMKRSEEKVSFRVWVRQQKFEEDVSPKANAILGLSMDKPKKKVWVVGKSKHNMKPTLSKKK